MDCFLRNKNVYIKDASRKYLFLYFYTELFNRETWTIDNVCSCIKKYRLVFLLPQTTIQLFDEREVHILFKRKRGNWKVLFQE